MLVAGIGAFAFGRAKRAVRMLTHMHNVRPYFLVSKYEDGSVSRLLDAHGFAYERVPFGYLGRARPTWTLITLSQVPWLYYRMLAGYREQKCDTVLILSIHPLLNALPPIFWLRYVRGANVVAYFGDIPANHRVHRIVGRIINHLTDRVIANSCAVKRGLVQIGVTEGNVRVIYNGIDPNRFAAAGSKDFAQRFNWPPEAVRIGYVGQFTPNKGARDFVLAAERVLKENQHCRFVMIGKLDDQNRYQQELMDYVNANGLREHVAFTGWLDDVETAYAGLDVVVVPSRYEDPAPNVNIEAMASGLPVIATRAGGSPELIADGETGFLVDQARPDQIAERILRLANDPALRSSLGRAGRQRASERFNIHLNARQVEEVILRG